MNLNVVQVQLMAVAKLKNTINAFYNMEDNVKFMPSPAEHLIKKLEKMSKLNNVLRINPKIITL